MRSGEGDWRATCPGDPGLTGGHGRQRVIGPAGRPWAVRDERHRIRDKAPDVRIVLPDESGSMKRDRQFHRWRHRRDVLANRSGGITPEPPTSSLVTATTAHGTSPGCLFVTSAWSGTAADPPAWAGSPSGIAYAGREIDQVDVGDDGWTRETGTRWTTTAWSLATGAATAADENGADEPAWLQGTFSLYTPEGAEGACARSSTVHRGRWVVGIVECDQVPGWALEFASRRPLLPPPAGHQGPGGPHLPSPAGRRRSPAGGQPPAGRLMGCRDRAGRPGQHRDPPPPPPPPPPTTPPPPPPRRVTGPLLLCAGPGW